MSPEVYYCVTKIYTCCCKKKQLGSRQRQLGKTAVIKARAYIVSMDRKTTIYGLEVGKIACFEKRVRDVHSNVFPYFTGLPVSSSLYCRYGTRAWLYDTVQASCDTLV